MKTLLILRHAKSSWKKAGVADHDRPLSGRGKKDAPRMGRLLDEEKLLPDLILSSTAKRARKTAAKAARSSGYAGEIVLIKELYLAEPETWLECLSAVDDKYGSVLVVGHNPGLEELLVALTGSQNRLPTAALARVQLDIDGWSELGRGARGTLVRLWLPREL